VNDWVFLFCMFGTGFVCRCLFIDSVVGCVIATLFGLRTGAERERGNQGPLLRDSIHLVDGARLPSVVCYSGVGCALLRWIRDYAVALAGCLLSGGHLLAYVDDLRLPLVSTVSAPHHPRPTPMSDDWRGKATPEEAAELDRLIAYSKISPRHSEYVREAREKLLKRYRARKPEQATP
jgi:hypothetical protein